MTPCSVSRLTIALWAAHGTAAPARSTSNWRAGSPPIAPATTTTPRRRCAPRSGEKLRNEDWAAVLLGESEFYDGDYHAARGRSSGPRMRGAAGRPRWRRSGSPTASGWRGTGARGGRLTRGSSKKRRRPPPTRRWRAFVSPRLAAARDPAAGKQQLAGDGADVSRSSAGRRGAAPSGALRCAAARRPQGAGPAAASDAGRSSAPDRLQAGRVADQGPALGRGAGRARQAARAAAAGAGRRARLPDRDDEVPHAARLRHGGELLLAAVPHLSGEKAASAAFHGARALSRVDRDDEAIAGYRKVIAQFPHSRYAAEAQYLSGWLDYNRGRFRESLPGAAGHARSLRQQRLRRRRRLVPGLRALPAGRRRRGAGRASIATCACPRPACADDERRRSRRLLAGAAAATSTGHKDDGGGRVPRVRPARAAVVLRPAGAGAAKAIGQRRCAVAPASKKPIAATPAAAQRRRAMPTVARAERAALDARAWTPRRAGRSSATRRPISAARLGGDKAAAVSCWTSTGGRTTFTAPTGWSSRTRAGALGADPRPATPASRAFWEAAFPKAYAPLVEHYGPPAGNPELYLYAIMRKESGFDPHDVSYADARGLLQMIPPTSARVAAGRAIRSSPISSTTPR